ncbi:adenylate/guanylate cyclase domain-containing protein [candidate division KSB1 bacterium]|nr:adenylate/guanylate cyclase domain-containing protein [candidate division KSB1 bacterium]
MVSPAVIEQLDPNSLQLGGKRTEITTLFADIRGFTTYSESLPPEKLVSILNLYLAAMAEAVLAQEGTIDKFMGDMLMAEFGALQPAPDHAERAVCAALKMQRRLLDLRQQWARQGWPSLQCRFGINTGAVLLGNMGAREIVDYTVLGETVNFAARLERLNKTYGTSLLISESTHAQLSPQLFRTRLLDRVKTHSSAMAINLYEVYGDLATFRSLRNTAYYQTYHEAFTAYLAQDFAGARTKFFQTLAFYPDDPATKILLERIATLLANGIPENWDGAATLGSL